MNQRIKLRTFLALSLVLTLLCGSQFASAAGKGAGKGPGAAGGERGGQQLDKIKELLTSLNLTPDQSKQIDQILDETRQDIAGMAKELKGLSPEARRQKIQPVIKDMIEKIRGVLTDDQKEQFRQKMEERRQQHGAAGGKAGPERKAPNADAPAPATQPGATNDTLAVPAPRGPMLQRVADRLATLDLSPEQKTKTDAILDNAARQTDALRADAQANPDAIRDKAKALFQTTRQQIAAVLTPEQQQKLSELREAALPSHADTSPPGAPSNAKPDTTPNTTLNTAAAKAAAVSSTTAPAVAQSKTRALYPGADAPPFRLNRLSGSSVTLDSFVNKPLVLIFGSYTCPTFRDKVDEIDKLARRYQGRAAFLIIYTREAYPANEWEVQRNLTEKIKVEQHKSLQDRQQLAKLARDGLKIQTDIAVDDIDDAVTDAYDAMPNGAYVLLNGKIIARQKWADPLGLPTFIDAATRKSKAL